MDKRNIKKGFRSNLLSKITSEQILIANEMAKKSRGISKMTMGYLKEKAK